MAMVAAPKDRKETIEGTKREGGGEEGRQTQSRGANRAMAWSCEWRV